MKSFAKYYLPENSQNLVEKTDKVKVIEALVSVDAAVNNENEYSFDKHKFRLLLYLDPKLNYADKKNAISQKALLEQIFNYFTEDQKGTKDKTHSKFVKAYGKDYIPYAINIIKLESPKGQVPDNLSNDEKTALSLNGKTSNNKHPLSNLLQDGKKNKTIFFNNEAYFDTGKIESYTSTNAKHYNLVKNFEELKASTETPDDISDDEVNTDEPTQSTENPPEEPQQNEEPNTTEVDTDDASTVSEPEVELPNTENKKEEKRIQFVTTIQEVINSDGTPVLIEDPVELPLVLPLDSFDNIATTQFTSLFADIASAAYDNYKTKHNDNTIPLLVTISDVEYIGLSNEEQTNVEKYIYDTSIVFNSKLGKKRGGKLEFTPKTCLDINSEDGKRYYKDIINDYGDTEEWTMINTTDKHTDNTNEINRSERTSAANSFINTINKGLAKTKNTTSTNYTKNDTKLAMDILTALGVNKNNAEAIIAKFIN